MKRSRLPLLPWPLLVAEMTMASYETIALRGLMIAGGTCSAAEWQRMLQEKMEAAGETAQALMRAGYDLADPAPVLAPWHRRAQANARRLRRRRS